MRSYHLDDCFVVLYELSLNKMDGEYSFKIGDMELYEKDNRLFAYHVDIHNKIGESIKEILKNVSDKIRFDYNMHKLSYNNDGEFTLRFILDNSFKPINENEVEERIKTEKLFVYYAIVEIYVVDSINKEDLKGLSYSVEY